MHASSKPHRLLLSLILLCHNITIGAEYRISSASGFTDFVSNVNSGTNYEGTTVYLDSDLSISKEIESIGKSYTYQFRGVFDGQGHVISNLKMSASSQYTGLFGYSQGLTIRNVVLDSSCSISSSHSSSTAYVGGIIGSCYSHDGHCGIEGNVNMVSVTFSGNVNTHHMYIGGIVGLLQSYFPKYSIYVRNCANYGFVTHSGTSGHSHIGGIAGCFSYTKSYMYIQNCLNYGEITHNGTTSNTLHFGGIIGTGSYIYIENCVSAGKITLAGTVPTTSCVGNTVGQVHSYTYINYCYYTSNVELTRIYGSGTPTSITGTSNHSTDVDTELVSNLNINATSCNWTRWFLNANSNRVTFKVNGNVDSTFSSNLIITPSLVSDWRSFVGWFTDSSFATLFTGSSVSESTTLYGRWDMYSVSFNPNGGSISEPSMNVSYNSAYGELPDGTREGYTFNGWFTEKTGGTKITYSSIHTSLFDITLHAQWTINNYTLKFIFNNEVKDDVRILDFNTSIIYPEDPVKEGYSFKWNSTAEFMPAHDLTIAAQWTINNYTLIFDLGNRTILESTVEYNEKVVYPENVVRDGYTFNGWDITVERMPARNTTITAVWIKSSKHPKSSSFYPSLILIMGISIPVLIAIFVVVVVIFLLVRKRHKNVHDEKKFEMDKPLIDKDRPSSGYVRVVSMERDEVESNVPTRASKIVLPHLYARDYAKPTMQKALAEVDLAKKQIQMICDACENAATFIADEGRLFDGFTIDDAAAIAMYTYDFGPKGFENNPYRIINRSLVRRDYKSLQKASGLLYLVMTALRKLPSVTGNTLYRGVRSEVNLDKDHYYKGNIITWPALSSTTPSIDTTKDFLAKGSKRSKAVGTLFIIDGGWGYDIQPYSLFPGEAEILLEPERQFEVVSVVPSPGITIINLRMLDTPLILHDVFKDR